MPVQHKPSFSPSVGNGDLPPSKMDSSSTRHSDAEEGATRAMDSDEDGSSENYEQPRRNRRQVWIYSLVLALVGSLALNIALSLILLTDKRNKEDESIRVPTHNGPSGLGPTVFPDPQFPSVGPGESSQPGTPLTYPAPPTAPPAPNPLETSLVEFLKSQGVEKLDEKDGPTSSKLAVDWLVEEATSQGGTEFYLDEILVQRFALLVTLFELQGGQEMTIRRHLANDSEPQGAISGEAACNWPGVECENAPVVSALHWHKRGYTGTIPSEIGLLSQLTHLDLSQNAIAGSIPEELYDLELMQALYLYQNALTGSISSKIGQWDQLERLHLSHNRLTGGIPVEMRSQEDEIRKYIYINLYKNQLSGSIPTGLRWRNLFLLDLGFNQFSGPIPDEFNRFSVLRHLRLDHNQLTGPLPYSTIDAGGGRLTTLRLDHNQLKGWAPGHFRNTNLLVAYTIHENNFDGMDDDTCELSVFEWGEMVEFNADCDICTCDKLCKVNCK